MSDEIPDGVPVYGCGYCGIVVGASYATEVYCGECGRKMGKQ